MDETLRRARFLLSLFAFGSLAARALPIAPEHFAGPAGTVWSFPLARQDRLVAEHLAKNWRRPNVLVLHGHGTADGAEVFGLVDALPLARWLFRALHGKEVDALFLLACSSGVDGSPHGAFAARLDRALASLGAALPGGIYGTLGNTESQVAEVRPDLSFQLGLKIMDYGRPPRTLADGSAFLHFRRGEPPAPVPATALLPPLGLVPLLTPPSEDQRTRDCIARIAEAPPESFIFPPSSGNDEALER